MPPDAHPTLTSSCLPPEDRPDLEAPRLESARLCFPVDPGFAQRLLPDHLRPHLFRGHALIILHAGVRRPLRTPRHRLRLLPAAHAYYAST